MPKIGLRILKTSLAVFICLLIDAILKYFSLKNTFFVELESYYSPFFAGIATVYCLHQNKSNSIKQAKIRAIGSIIGGFFGVLVVLFSLLFKQIDITNFISYTIFSLGIIPLIYITVLTKQTSSTFVTCLTYLSVTVGNHNDLNLVCFALSRITCTLIGLGISLLINNLHFKRHTNNNVLFVVNLDSLEMNGYVEYKLNTLIKRGCNITLLTTRTAATINNVIKNIDFKIPLLVCHAHATYNVSTSTYENTETIKLDTRKKLDNFLDEKKINRFTHVIIDDILHIYHKDLQNEMEMIYYNKRKKTYFKNYINGRAPKNKEILFYLILGDMTLLNKVINFIMNTDLKNELTYSIKWLEDGFYSMRIFAKDKNNILKLKNNLGKVDVLYLSEDNSLLFDNEYFDSRIKVKNYNEIIKVIEKVFYSKKDFSKVIKDNNHISRIK